MIDTCLYPFGPISVESEKNTFTPEFHDVYRINHDPFLMYLYVNKKDVLDELMTSETDRGRRHAEMEENIFNIRLQTEEFNYKTFKFKTDD